MELLARDSLRIVHVEDDHEFAQLSETVLKRAGFEQPIIRCNDGILALHYFSMIEPELAPHVILLDLHMANMSGLEVLHWLRHDHNDQDVAVYLLTSSDNPEDRRQAAAEGVTEYIVKSHLFAELIQDLDHVIERANRNQLAEMMNVQGVMAELAFMGKFAEEIIVLSDVHGRIAWVNDHFVRTYGFTLDEVLGKKSHSLLDGPESDHASVEVLHHAVRSVDACECQTVNQKKDGTTHPVHISMGPVFSNERHEGFLAVERDLSEEEVQLATETGHR